MHNIIRIEELVYSRLSKVNKADWIEMLSMQGVSKSYAILMDDYILVEQADYRFNDKGEYISSERMVYNIDYATYDIAENTSCSEDTEIIDTIHYDSQNDLFFVYHTHYRKSEKTKEQFAYIFSEADMPSSPPSIQEKEADNEVIKEDDEVVNDEKEAVNNTSIPSVDNSEKLTTLTYNNHDFKWTVGSKVLLDELFSGPTKLIGKISFQFRKKFLFVFMQSYVADQVGKEAEYEIPAKAIQFMQKYQEKYYSTVPRVFLFVCDDGKVASFYDEVKFVRANKNSITIKSLLRI